MNEFRPHAYALLAALLFGISLPLSKLLVGSIHPVALAGLLYLGAFAGLFIYSLLAPGRKTVPLEKKDFPWLAGAVLAGGVIAPISMLSGLSLISGFSASLLLNLEAAATALIAVVFFRESAGKRLWFALACMTLGAILLTGNTGGGAFNLAGPLLILLAMACWGIDNNLTRVISGKDPAAIGMVKGLAAGSVSLSLALILGFGMPSAPAALSGLLLGAFSYGLSLLFFIKALDALGSFRASAFLSLAPFIGAASSLILLGEAPGLPALPAAGLMAIGAWLLLTEKHGHPHVHEKLTHSHSHAPGEAHHTHEHSGSAQGPHAHSHIHDSLAHAHSHWPDSHHRHGH
jgi:drug/metabolite transporter (DMT)-like permease